jgi:hypothetical protein
MAASGSVFGGNASSSLFGNRSATSGTSIFGSSQQPAASGSIFGASGSSVFGSPAGQQQPTG